MVPLRVAVPPVTTSPTPAVLVLRFPKPSSIRTVTPGVIVAPALVLVGCWEKASLVAAAGLTVTPAVAASAVCTVSATVTVWLPLVRNVSPPVNVRVPASAGTNV